MRVCVTHTNLNQLGWSHRDPMGQSCRSSVESTSPLEMCTQVQLKGLRSWLSLWPRSSQAQPLLPLECVGQEPSFRCQSQTMSLMCMRTAWIIIGDQWVLLIQTMPFFLKKLDVSFPSPFYMALRDWIVNFYEVSYEDPLQESRDEINHFLDHTSTSFYPSKALVSLGFRQNPGYCAF